MNTTFSKKWVIGFAIIVLLFIVFYVTGGNQPKHYSSYDSNSPSPTGVKAIYTYLEGEGVDVQRRNHPPTLLSMENKDQLLLMIEPHFVPVEEDMKEYIRFMEAGNTIVLFSQNPRDMFGLTPTYIEPSDDEVSTVVKENGDSFSAIVLSYIRFELSEQQQEILSDELGTIAFSETIGDGKLIVTNSPHWMANDWLLDEDHIPLNLALLHEAIGSGEVFFDEYIHTPQNVPSYMTVYPQWFLLVMLQGMIVVVFWLWNQGKRFGPLKTAREEYVRFSDEAIQALAAWFIRGKRYHDSLLIQADYIKLRLQEKWGVPYQSTWVETSDYLERKWKGMKKKDIALFVEGLTTALQSDTLSKQEFLRWSKKLDQLQKGIEE
ncbi:DUF4350 domain-containing protein [Bacillus alkalicellulosilyticus]|uniref:DUF4350 domain-containing protein n=1 Tax=Alkalihalobacterium alkalicellulosilyticum TaxID=1912214 RepID=UPI00148354C2|nr:DUF4350 domain-containing protein [Bacillus alkalicellulosilyticus]